MPWTEVLCTWVRGVRKHVIISEALPLLLRTDLATLVGQEMAERLISLIAAVSISVPSSWWNRTSRPYPGVSQPLGILRLIRYCHRPIDH
jgi:hypothetical protein